MWLGFPVSLEQMHKERAALVNPEFDRRRMAVGAVLKRITELLYDARGVSGIKSKGKARAATIAVTNDDELYRTAQAKVPDVQVQPKVDMSSDLTPWPPPFGPQMATRSGQPPISATKKSRGEHSAKGTSMDVAV